jgi:hypothetical protein
MAERGFSFQRAANRSPQTVAAKSLWQSGSPGSRVFHGVSSAEYCDSLKNCIDSGFLEILSIKF